MAIDAREPAWRRLFWLLPTALALLLLSLDGFLLLLQGGTSAPTPPKPVDVEVVEVPPSPPPPAATVAPQAVESPPAPAPPARVAEAPAPVETPPAPPPPTAAVEAPAAAAEVPPPALTAENRVPAPTPPPPEAPGALSAPPAPAQMHGPQITTVPPQEVTRGGFPGMMTERLAPAAPLTKEEWDRLAKIYNTGDDHQGVVEAMRSPGRAARSTRMAPLTKEEYARLAKIYHTADPNSTLADAMVSPILSARSERAPPLTKEEYAAQARIYWTGQNVGGTTPDQREAGLRGALSFEASLVTPTAQIDYGNRFHVASGDRRAMAIEPPPPEVELSAS